MRRLIGDVLLFIMALALGVSVAFACNELVKLAWDYTRGLDPWFRLAVNMGLVTPFTLAALILLLYIISDKDNK